MEVARRVTRRERVAVRSHAVGYLETGVAQTAVAMKLNVNRTTVYRWWKRNCKGETPADKTNSGRPRAACLKSTKSSAPKLPAREGKT